MGFYLSLPLLFLQFWFIELPKGMLLYFGSLNMAFFRLFSLPIFFKTFFQPIKNEYRKGLVGFSIGMGMFIKTLMIIFDLLLLVVLLTVEITVFFFILLLPLFAIGLLFVPYPFHL